MRLIFLIFGLVYITKASRIKNLFQQAVKPLAEKYANEVKETPDGQKMTPQLRKKVVHDMVTSPDHAFEILANYGCWCNLEEAKMGHGEPKDEIDAMCKEMFTNFQCTSMNVEDNGGDPCSATTDIYDAIGLGTMVASASMFYSQDGFKEQYDQQMANIYTYCESQNVNDPCSVGACKAEAKFLSTTMQKVMFGVMERTYVHGADFDPNFECTNPGVTNGGSSEGHGKANRGKVRILKCCGDSPNSFMYDQNKISCCPGALKRFNPTIQMCEGDTVKHI